MIDFGKGIDYRCDSVKMILIVIIYDWKNIVFSICLIVGYRFINKVEFKVVGCLVKFMGYFGWYGCVVNENCVFFYWLECIIWFCVYRF